MPMKPSNPIRIIIADDHYLFRSAMKNHLEAVPRFKVIAEATNGEELFNLVSEMEPDIVITDIQMPRMDGILTTKKIIASYPKIKVLAVSFLESEFAVVDMLEAGAKGYLCKNMERGELEVAVESLHKGEPYFSLQSSPTLIREIALSKFDPFKLKQSTSLSEREIEIIQLTCEEKTSQQIGEKLEISARTVETHKSNIYRKIGVSSIGLVIYAIRNGLYIIPTYHRKAE